MMRHTRLVSFAALLAAGPALALPPLSEVGPINDGLRNVKIADEIRSHCGDISARMIQAWSMLNGLKSKASAMGYSADQIDDFVQSDADRKRLEAEAEAYLAAGGVTRGNEASYCALGRREISSGSQIGGLLREK